MYSGQIPLHPFCQILLTFILEGGFSLSTSTLVCSSILFHFIFIQQLSYFSLHCWHSDCTWWRRGGQSSWPWREPRYGVRGTSPPSKPFQAGKQNGAVWFCFDPLPGMALRGRGPLRTVAGLPPGWIALPPPG